MKTPPRLVHRYQPPKGSSGRTLLLLHGTGGDENSLIPLSGALDATAGILAVRGQVLENGAPRFFRRLSEGVFDLDDLRFRTHELADFIADSASEYGFSLNSLVAVGYSNGANIASSVLFLRPEVLAGGILLRAMTPFETESALNLAGKRVLLLEGKFDPIVPLENAEMLHHQYVLAGAQTELRWIESDHRLTRSELNLASEWLQGA
ncbi:MAG: alpha/beta hydrolase [Fimbriimonas sp.]|nr:alpha/beta hydrolase [Fimbriimonas sp.]